MGEATWLRTSESYKVEKKTKSNPRNKMHEPLRASRERLCANEREEAFAHRLGPGERLVIPRDGGRLTRLTVAREIEIVREVEGAVGEKIGHKLNVLLFL